LEAHPPYPAAANVRQFACAFAPGKRALFGDTLSLSDWSELQRTASSNVLESI
jgi:hypothetical protein